MAQSIEPTRYGEEVAATERARRASAVAAGGADGALPEAEVSVKAPRRRFTAQYKREILEQADRCSEPGEVGALLRREGLYSSHLSKWRAQREQGMVNGLAPRQRGRKAVERSEESIRIERLERDNAKLREQLEQAELIIDVQKKVSRLFGKSMPPRDNDETNS